MVMSWPYPESNVLALSRVATSANPRQPPMNRSVTLPADGGGVRLAPVEWKRPRRHRAVARALVVQRRSASLARHVICSWRLVPRTPRHMPRHASRSLGCAVAARRLLPLSPLLRRFRYAHASRSRKPLRYAPGRAGPRGCGGAAAP
jgi:hypothetical protein